MTKPTDEEIVKAMVKVALELNDHTIFDEMTAALAVAKTMLAQQSAPDSVHVVFKETAESNKISASWPYASYEKD